MLPLLTLCLLLAAAPPDAGQLAYVAGATPALRSVYVTDFGTEATVEVGTGHGDSAPVWSPDGVWLAFTTTRGAGRGVRLVRPADGHVVEVPHVEVWNDGPGWSADGRRLAYAAGTGLEQRIMVYEPASGLESVWGGDERGLMRPVWLAPESLAVILLLMKEQGEVLPPEIIQSAMQTGAMFAVAATPGDNGITTDIVVVVQEGAFPLPNWLLPSPEGDYEEWAAEPDPRGQRFAFESNDGGDREIFTVSKSGAIDVSNHRAADWNPVWSPDGKWLAFESFRDGRRGIYRVYRDTIRVHPIAGGDAYEAWSPAWSPDGLWVAFTTTLGGTPQVAVVQVDGGEPTVVSAPGIQAFAPAWRPVEGRAE
jgi:Tol biopolymer transport system component